jgi:hypothetical protein
MGVHQGPGEQPLLPGDGRGSADPPDASVRVPGGAVPALAPTGLDPCACGARGTRAKADPGRDVAPVDGEALRDRAATVVADARLVRVPVNQPPWMPTGLAVTTGGRELVGMGIAHLLRPLAVALRPRLALLGRVDDGEPQDGARDTVKFRADRTGELRLGSVCPGVLQADGTITIVRIPYRARRLWSCTLRSRPAESGATHTALALAAMVRRSASSERCPGVSRCPRESRGQLARQIRTSWP